jgi:hypothetical protein
MQIERVEELVVNWHQIPQAFDRIDRLARRFASSWMMGRVLTKPATKNQRDGTTQNNKGDRWQVNEEIEL